jgi:cold shock CspA family protein
MDMYGTIDRVVHKHGFGFIRAYDGVEVFFHRRSLIELDFHSLKEGQMVEFEEQRAPGEDVPRAVVVRPRRRLPGSR